MTKTSLRVGLTTLSMGALAFAVGCGGESSRDQSSATPEGGSGGASSPGAGGAGGAGMVAMGGSGGDMTPPTGAGGSGGEFGAADAGMAMGGDDSFCDALSVFRTSCQTCHGAELSGGAPMSLVTYEDTQAPAPSDSSRMVYELVGERIHDTEKPMPPSSQEPLSDEEIAAVDAWVEAGAPAPSGECTDAAPEPTEEEVTWPPEDADECYEIRVSDANGGEPYVVGANVEETLDFNIPVPWAGEDVQAVGLRPIKNNKRVVHHWILYAGALDFVTSWSPGKPTEVFPEDVGVHMPSSGEFRLNMHYYNVGNDQDEPDESGVEICVTRDPRPNTATTYMFGSIGAANAPANSTVTNEATCNVQASEPVHLLTSSPHMHSYGVHAQMEIFYADGGSEMVEDSPFDWEDQHVTSLADRDIVLETGDEVVIRCKYKNTTNRSVSFGSSSQDEMCFNFARYYPMDALSCGGGGLF